MESQNHYYGHSGAFAAYVGLSRPRHIRGLVQHGWTAASPVQTHFRDFPTIGAPDGRRDRSLFVWSHKSRAWDPESEYRTTVAIGAPWAYLCASADTAGQAGTSAPERSGTVILPVHGIPTQRLRGNHVAVARRWLESEGPSTVCLYHVEARDPRVVAAYVDAGHRCVTLGERTDGAFLGRLHTLLSTAQRVVSNRLSTPIVYAAALGIDVSVRGDPMRLDGEAPEAVSRVTDTWPEFSDPAANRSDVKSLARSELGADALRTPATLSTLLGWDRSVRVGPWLDHWLLAPVDRAVTNVKRRTADEAGGVAVAGAPLSRAEWIAGAAAYLPHPLPSTRRPRFEQPLRVAAQGEASGVPAE